MKKISIEILLVVLIALLSNCKEKKQKNQPDEDANHKITGVVYPQIKEKYTVIEGNKNQWDDKLVHTLSIIESPYDNEYKYWGYYGLDNYNEKNSSKKKAGLIFSNDLKKWIKYPDNPIINDNCRWPTAITQDSRVYLFYAQYNTAGDSRIVMQSAGDGIHFNNLTEIVAYKKGEQNQNPFIYYNLNDRFYYLFYYNGTERNNTDKHWNIMYKKAKNIDEIQNSKPVLLITSKETMAAPSVVFYNNKYYLLVEEYQNRHKMDRWVTNAFYAHQIDGRYKRVENNPVLADNDACALQYLLNNKLYVTYSHALNDEKTKWNLKMIQIK